VASPRSAIRGGLSPRVLLNKEFFAETGLAALGFESYSDMNSVSLGRIDMAKHPRIACVVDSVHLLSLFVVKEELVGGVPSCVHVTPEPDLLVRASWQASRISLRPQRQRHPRLPDVEAAASACQHGRDGTRPGVKSRAPAPWLARCGG
jgi:hypothetical protein